MSQNNSKVVKNEEGQGYRGKRMEAELENFLIYSSSLQTSEAVEIVVEGADNWLQFHYQLSGKTNTLIVEEDRIVEIDSNSFAILYQKKGCCKIRFPDNCVYKSFGFRVDPEYFVHSFLKDFQELTPIKRAIENNNLFYLDKKYASLDVKTREIIHEILENPYQGNLYDVYVKHKLIELIFYSIPVLRENAKKLSPKNRLKEKTLRGPRIL